MNATLEHVEEILDGIEPDLADVPAGEIPDYLPRMDGTGGGTTC
jgi:hypothetical protein